MCCSPDDRPIKILRLDRVLVAKFLALVFKAVGCIHVNLVAGHIVVNILEEVDGAALPFGLRDGVFLFWFGLVVALMKSETPLDFTGLREETKGATTAGFNR